MYLRFTKPHSLSEITRSTRPLTEFRRHFPIAIIDNETLAHTSSLHNHGFSIKELGDISDLAAVSEYPIITCDIKDVGVHFASPYEGAHLISEIKKRYPDKYIIAYSGGAYGPEYKKLLDYSDVFLRRGAPLNDWISSLDKAIQTIGDPIYRWKRIRSLMLEYDVSAFEVFLIEDAFIKSILKQDEFILGKALQRASKVQSTANILSAIAEPLITFVKLYIHIIT